MENRRCPYCSFHAADTDEEVAHMQAEHPQVIEERLRSAGFSQQPDGSWLDRLADDIDIVVEVVD